MKVRALFLRQTIFIGREEGRRGGSSSGARVPGGVYKGPQHSVGIWREYKPHCAATGTVKPRFGTIQFSLSTTTAASDPLRVDRHVVVIRLSGEEFLAILFRASRCLDSDDSSSYCSNPEHSSNDPVHNTPLPRLLFFVPRVRPFRVRANRVTLSPIFPNVRRVVKIV